MKKSFAFLLCIVLVLILAFSLTACSAANTNIDVSSILNTAIPVLLTAVVIPLIIGIGTAIKNSFKEKTENEKLQKYFDLACDAIMTAVAETMQVFVDGMKKNGQWNEENAKKAFDMAMLKAKELMGVAALQALPEIVGDLDTWIRSKIEAATLEKKIYVSETSEVLGRYE